MPTILDILVCLCFLAFILGLPVFSALVRRNRLRSRVWWTLDRWRACVAWEGDPGPWKERQ